MSPSKLIEVTAKSAVLLGIAGGLVWFSRYHPVSTAVAPDDDDPQFAPVVSVRTGKVSRQTLRAFADVYGVVEPRPARGTEPAGGADVSVPAAAVVAAVDCVEGQTVEAGRPLFHLDARAADAAVARAAAIRVAARAAVDGSGALAARDVVRLKTEAAVADANLLQAKAAGELLTTVAPVAGTVTMLSVRPDESLAAGTVAVRIVDLTKLIVAAAVPVAEMSAIKAGQPVEIVLPDTTINGTVTFVDPAIDPATGAGSVDVALPADTTLRPGETVHVRVVTAEHKDCLAVLADAVVENAHGESAVNFVVQEGRQSKREPVAAGLRDRGYVEVSGSAVREGADVVTTGSFALPDHAGIAVGR